MSDLDRPFKKIIKGTETIERFINNYGEKLNDEDIKTLKDRISILQNTINKF